jgi:hypothetical protein
MASVILCFSCKTGCWQWWCKHSILHVTTKKEVAWSGNLGLRSTTVHLLLYHVLPVTVTLCWSGIVSLHSRSEKEHHLNGWWNQQKSAVSESVYLILNYPVLLLSEWVMENIDSSWKSWPIWKGSDLYLDRVFLNRVIGKEALLGKPEQC